jgi:hypothetical protein
MVDVQPRTTPIINSRRARCILAVIEAPVQRKCEDHVQNQTVLQMIYRNQTVSHALVPGRPHGLARRMAQIYLPPVIPPRIRQDQLPTHFFALFAPQGRLLSLGPFTS